MRVSHVTEDSIASLREATADNIIKPIFYREDDYASYGKRETEILGFKFNYPLFNYLVMGYTPNNRGSIDNKDPDKQRNSFFAELFDEPRINEIFDYTAVVVEDPDVGKGYKIVSNKDYLEGKVNEVMKSTSYIGARALEFLISNLDYKKRSYDLAVSLLKQKLKSGEVEKYLSLSPEPRDGLEYYCKGMYGTPMVTFLESMSPLKNNLYSETHLMRDPDDLKFALLFDTSHKLNGKKSYAKEALRYIENTEKDNLLMFVVKQIKLPPRNLYAKDMGDAVTYSGSLLMSRLLNTKGNIAQRGDNKILWSKQEFVTFRQTLLLAQNAYNKVFFSEFDSSKRDSLEGLIDHMKDKKGLIRKRILGKVICCSARAVIVPDPTLKIDEVGIPFKVAADLFSYHLWIRYGVTTELYNRPIVTPLLEELMKEIPVILGRQPTLHTLSKQGFFAKVVEGSAIKMYPWAADGFNADYDGDQMAVTLALGEKAIAEVIQYMMSSKSILRPRDGKVFTTIKHEAVYGIYVMTKDPKEGEDLPTVPLPKSIEEIRSVVMVTPRAWTTYKNQKVLLGRALVCTALDDLIMRSGVSSEELRSNGINKLMKAMQSKPISGPMINKVVTRLYNSMTSEYNVISNAYKDTLEYLAAIGLTACTALPPSLDVRVFPIAKQVKKQQELANKNYELLRKGLLTVDEFATLSSSESIDQVNSTVRAIVKEDEMDILDIIDSGARGSNTNIDLLYGVKGDIFIPQTKNTVQVLGNYSQGLDTLEHCLSAQGTLSSMMLKTLEPAQTGYSMRKNVHLAINNRVYTDDCHSGKATEVNVLDIVRFLGVPISKETSDWKDTLIERMIPMLFGRYTEDSKEISYSYAEEISQGLADNLEELLSLSPSERLMCSKPLSVKIRTLSSCDETCVKCYGKSLSTWNDPEIGYSLGAVAATSIGEIGTQATMKAFQQGGKATEASEQELIVKILTCEDISELPRNTLAKIDGVLVVDKDKRVLIGNTFIGVDLYNYSWERIDIEVIPGRYVKKGDTIFTSGDISINDEIKYLQDEVRKQWLMTLKLYNLYYSAGVNIKHVEVIVDALFGYKIISNPNNNPYYSVGYYLNKKQANEAEQFGVKTRRMLVSYNTREKNDNSPLSGLAYQEIKNAIRRLGEKQKIKLEKSYDLRLFGKVKER